MKVRIVAVPLLALLALTGAVSAQEPEPAAAETRPGELEVQPADPEVPGAEPEIQPAEPAVTEIRKDTLLIERVQEENRSAMPARGETMAQVEARYGAPAEKLDPRGGQKRQWPTINRWVYPAFTVYFEKSRVIDVVANKAGEGEVGPKPPVK